MKRIAGMIMGIFILGLAIFLSDFNFRPSTDKDQRFKITDKQLMFQKEGHWQPFELFGVNINAGIPGAFPGEGFVSTEEYVRWLEDIGALGMNSIRVRELMPENFYVALAAYNQSANQAIYILQGITYDEIRLNQGVDPLSLIERKYYKEHIETVVNALHGNPASKSNIPFFDAYVTDVSDYLIGYCIGPEWQRHDVVYSEIMNDPMPYDGKYFSTGTGASVVESYMAEMLDYIVAYETKHYGVQHLVSFLGATDFHQNKRSLSQEAHKILMEKEADPFLLGLIDANHIQGKPSLESGYFVAFNVYDDGAFNRDERDNYKHIYEKLQAYYDIPVVITEYGYPTTRLATDYIDGTKAFISEAEQGQRIIESLEKIRAAGCMGSFLLEWKDSWYKSAWNTRRHKILDSSPYWNDAQTYSQSFGLMAYEPRRGDRLFYPDDSRKEWLVSDQLTENQGYQFYVANDEKYLYLMIASNEKSFYDKDVVIDFDVTDASGIDYSSQFDLTFESPVDFLVIIDGNRQGQLLVHEYYNTYRFEKTLKTLRSRPDLVEVSKEMDKFSPVLIDIVANSEEEVFEAAKPGVSVETGRLHSGNANPYKPYYRSYADYYIGETHLEIRIPWALLNFSDPSKKIIHEDYYATYSIKPKFIKGIGIGATIRDGEGLEVRMPSRVYSWRGWINPTYEKRFKQAYYMLKDLVPEQ